MISPSRRTPHFLYVYVPHGVQGHPHQSTWATSHRTLCQSIITVSLLCIVIAISTLLCVGYIIALNNGDIAKGALSPQQEHAIRVLEVLEQRGRRV